MATDERPAKEGRSGATGSGCPTVDGMTDLPIGQGELALPLLEILTASIP